MSRLLDQLHRPDTHLSKALRFGLALILVLSAIGLATPQPARAATLTVNTLADDESDGCAANACTLREAVTEAAQGDTIQFSVSGVITLASELEFNKDITIAGPAGGISLSGGDAVRVVHILSGTVTLNDLTVTNGYVDGFGAGIYVEGGKLILDRSTVMNNNTVERQSGAGIYIETIGDGELTNCTITGNVSQFDGGGIVTLNRNVKIDHCTITGNTAAGGGGGLEGTAQVSSSIITGNTANPDWGSDCYSDPFGGIDSHGYNLIGTGVHCQIQQAENPGTDRIGTNPARLDAGLGPLADNGGPTQTFLPQPGSPAIDTDFACTLNVDQRGEPRPLGSACDSGSVEVAYGSAPIANDQALSGPENQPIAGTLTATDPDGDTLTFALAAAPAHGSAVVNANGAFTYTPAFYFTGDDQFTFTAHDPQGNTGLGHVTLTVSSAPLAPLANPDGWYTTRDSDQPGGPSFNWVSTPRYVENWLQSYSPDSAGFLTVHHLQWFDIPTPGGFGFALNVNRDGFVNILDSSDKVLAQVLLYNTKLGVIPDVSKVFVFYLPDSQGVVVQYQDMEILSDSQTPHRRFTGQAIFNQDGSVVVLYKTAAGATGSLSGLSATDPSRSQIYPYTRIHDNLAVRYTFATYTAAPGQPIQVAAPGLLSNDFDNDATGALTAALKGAPANGAAVVNADGSFTYTPNADAPRTGSFTYTVTNSTEHASTGMVTVIANQAPITHDLTFEVNQYEGTGGQFDCQDPDGDPLSAVINTLPEHGYIRNAGNCQYYYWPFDFYTGPDSFTFTVRDIYGAEAHGKAAITVTPGNIYPMTSAIGMYKINTPATKPGLTYTWDEIQATGTRVDKDQYYQAWDLVDRIQLGFKVPFLTPTGVQYATQADIISNLYINFYDDLNNWVANIDLTDESWSLTRATSHIYYQVLQNPTRLVVEYSDLSTYEDGTLSVTAEAAVFPDGRAEYRYNTVQGPVYAAVHNTMDSSWKNYPGTELLSHSIIEIQPQVIQTPLNTPITLTQAQLLDDQYDPDGDALHVEDYGMGDTAAGKVAANPDGTFTFTPAADFKGWTYFYYNVIDSQGNISPAYAYILVGSIPTASAQSVEALQNKPFTGQLTGTDPDDGTLIFSPADAPAHGTVDIQQDGSFTYTPDKDYHGADSFTFQVRGSMGGQAQATVTITVKQPNFPVYLPGMTR